MNNYERFIQTISWQPADRIMTYEVMDNTEILKYYGGFDPSHRYSFEELVEVNARMLKNIGIDVTRNIHDPVNHWMGAKIANWIRFFGVNPDNWELSHTGDTAWISKRPFSNLRELEKNMPVLPKLEEVREWYEPVLQTIKEIFDSYDLVYIGGIEGPICDAYTYTDTELFCTALYDAPELVSHIMDCTGTFSAYIARIFAEHPASPLLFMGEDMAGKTGPFFSPDFIREHGLPRWRWITEPLRERGIRFLFHTDGRYGPLLPIIFEELGADGLNPIERMGCNDIFAIRESYPDRLLFGNVCCSSTLPFGTLEDIEDETLELIEKIGPQGGILIGSSSEVNDIVPRDHAVKLYETVLEYGSYPIDCERIRKRRAEIRSRLKLRKSIGDS
ncbi:hypothetical protein LLG96_19900 [bacterium]|nr:hypothetical protein [bacterium]